MPSSNLKLCIFDTHPIQYRSPVFRALAEQKPDTKVFFFNEAFDGRKWWFHEYGKIPKQKWNLSLREGFDSEVLESHKGLFSFFRKARQIIKERPKAVLIYGWYLPEHWILWFLCKWYRVGLIFVGETFSQGVSNWRRRLKAFLHPLFFNGVKQFISIGEKTFDFYKSLRVEPNRITKAKYCVDTKFFSLPEDKASTIRSEMRAELKIPEDAVVLLFVGRLFERKRPWDMISLQRKLQQYEKLHTVIVGNGPLEKELHAKVQESERIHFPGFCDQAKTRAMYYAADFLVVPSEYETWGLVINEAFATATPAIVTDTCGAAHDLVVQSKTGLVYPVGNMEIAAAMLSPYLENPSLVRTMGEVARERVNHEYTIKHFASAIEQAFAKVAAT